jgi:signal peptidase II
MQEMRRHLVFLIVPAIFLLDRWTKVLIADHIPYLRGIEVGPFISIVHARNLGGAFSFLASHESARYVFTVLPLLIVGALVYVLIAYKFAFAKTVSLALILAGAAGNIYDRLSYGYVIDFLDVHYGIYHWPAFNVADISISTGICLWIFVEVMVSLKSRDGRGKGDVKSPGTK